MSDEPTPLPDDRFMANVREARENGYETCCSECGIGLYDDSDLHDRGCSLYVAYDWSKDRPS